MTKEVRMTLAGVIAAAMFCLAVLVAGSARAATIMPVTLVCFTTTEAINILANEHKKKPHAYGKNSSDFLVQLWLADSGAYTVLVSSPQGMSCELSSGQEWSGINSIPKGDKS